MGTSFISLYNRWNPWDAYSKEGHIKRFKRKTRKSWEEIDGLWILKNHKCFGRKKIARCASETKLTYEFQRSLEITSFRTISSNDSKLDERYNNNQLAVSGSSGYTFFQEICGGAWWDIIAWIRPFTQVDEPVAIIESLWETECSTYQSSQRQGRKRIPRSLYRSACHWGEPDQAEVTRKE